MNRENTGGATASPASPASWDLSKVPYRAKLCRAKVTNFLKGDENFARRIISPDKLSPNHITIICLNDLSHLGKF